jgi:predicted nucleotidyltransferase component of viral defense system
MTLPPTCCSRRSIALPIHDRYDFEMPAVPASIAEEIVAEKLARYGRASLARDLYDLAWFASRVFDEALVRRLTVLKVWCDVVDDGLGGAPFDPEQVLKRRAEGEFRPEAIGYLTAPVDIAGWATAVSRRYEFLRNMDDFERQVARCSRSDERLVRQAVADLGPAEVDGED